MDHVEVGLQEVGVQGEKWLGLCFRERVGEAVAEVKREAAARF